MVATLPQSRPLPSRRPPAIGGFSPSTQLECRHHVLLEFYFNFRLYYHSHLGALVVDEYLNAY